MAVPILVAPIDSNGGLATFAIQSPNVDDTIAVFDSGMSVEGGKNLPVAWHVPQNAKAVTAQMLCRFKGTVTHPDGRVTAQFSIEKTVSVGTDGAAAIVICLHAVPALVGGSQ
jgi:hypothetical protein